MPLYDLECEPCQRFLVDVFFTLNETPTCSYCNAPARVIISPVRTVGPMPSKPLRLEQLGREFTSNSELREYKQAHPEAQFLDKNDSDWREHYDDVRNRCEKTASKAGYKSFKDFQNEKKKIKVAKQSEASLTQPI